MKIETPTVQTDFNKIRTMEMALPSTPKDEDEKIAAEVLLFKKHYNNSIDFIVEDDGMSPLYNIGEYVAGINLANSQIGNAIGTDCIVQLENGKAMLRQLRQDVDRSNQKL